MHQIHSDLLQAKSELLSHGSTAPSCHVLELMIKIGDKQATPHWKQMISALDCGQMSLSIALRTLMIRRAEVYTFYNKFSIS